MIYHEHEDKLEIKDLCYLDALEQIAHNQEEQNKIIRDVLNELMVITKFLLRS